MSDYIEHRYINFFFSGPVNAFFDQTNSYVFNVTNSLKNCKNVTEKLVKSFLIKYVSIQ